MTRVGCPDEAELFVLVDEPAQATEIAAHVVGCASCGAKKAELEALLGDLREPVRAYPADEFVDRLKAALPKATAPRARPRRLVLTALSVLAAAAMLVLAPRVLLNDEHGADGFTARGAPGEAGAKRDVLLALDVVTRSPGREVATVAASAAVVTSRRAHLLVSYATKSAHETYYLLAFAVDTKGDVHWLNPSYEDASADPVAVALPPGRALTAMATETLLDDVPAGRVRVYGVLSPRPLHVHDVESLSPSALETSETVAASLPGADIRAWELRIAEGGAP